MAKKPVMLPELGPSEIIADSWSNMATGLGTRRDKRTLTGPTPNQLSYNDLTNVYLADDMCQAIVDIPAAEMTRAWCDVKIEGDEEAAEEYGAMLDDLGAKEAFRQCLRWQRLYGGAGILIGVNDGLPLDRPVNEAAIKSVDYLNSFDTMEMRPIEWENNPAKKGYGEPTIYQITPRVFGMGAASLLQRVHASRIVRFNGVQANRIQYGINSGWGDSIIERCYDILRDFASAYGGAAALLQDFSQGVFKLKGLAAAIGADRGNLIEKRLQMIDMSRSMLRSVVIDGDGEDFSRQSTPVNGLDVLLEKFETRVAAAARMPVSLLHGQSPSGLGASGDVNLQWYTKQIGADQETSLTPGLVKVVKYLMLAEEGEEAENWSIEWRPLDQPSENEKATRNFTQAQADQIYLVNGVLGPDAIRESRFGGDKYSVDTSVDTESSEDALGMTVPRIGPDGQPVEMVPGQAPAASAAVADVAQVMGVITQVANNSISRDSGIAILVELMGMDAAVAAKVIGQPKPAEPKPDATTEKTTAVIPSGDGKKKASTP